MNNEELFEKFKNREVKAKDIFYIKEIDKPIAYEFIRRYHYLADAKFFSMYNFGLHMKNSHELVGVATYSLPQGTCATMGWFSLPANDNSIVELSRLCLLPCLNGTNATSYLLGNSMKMLKPYGIRAIITLADASRHVGSIYQVCNFKYYGVATNNSDFYDVGGGKNVRGKPSQMHGVYLPRTTKHRYAYILDPTLKPNYKEQKAPTKDTTYDVECCHNKFVVYDNRFNEYFTCPKCTSKIVQITKEEYDRIINSTFDKDKLKEYVEGIIKEHIDKENPYKEFSFEDLF